MGMTCEQIRESLSARMDGEADPADATVDDHVAGCDGCREWLAKAALLHRKVRLAPAPEVPDLTMPVMTAVAAEAAAALDRARHRRLLLRVALAAIAVAQLAMAGPLLLFGHDHTAPVHVAHEVGSFDAALGLGLLLAALCPRLAAGMTPLVGVITGLLLLTAASDVIGGRTDLLDEAPHLWDLVGFLVLSHLAFFTGHVTNRWRRA